MHKLIDTMVDEYFPPIYDLETKLNAIEDNTKKESIAELIDQLFDLRNDLSKMSTYHFTDARFIVSND